MNKAGVLVKSVKTTITTKNRKNCLPSSRIRQDVSNSVHKGIKCP